MHFSFEFFPPKTPESDAKLWQVIQTLAAYNPSFVSVTFGAGGTTRDKTFQLVQRIAQETSLKPAAHLTCAGASRADIDVLIDEYWQAGIRHIVALRGDPPGDMTAVYVPHAQGYAYSSDLIAGIKSRYPDMYISAAAYPEKHPQAATLDADIDALKAKVDAGADQLLTQFFFDADIFLRFRDKVVAAGVTIPLIPGILPIYNLEQVKRFAAACNTSIPSAIPAMLAQTTDAAVQQCLAMGIAVDLCQRLKAGGVENFHLYKLNLAEIPAALEALQQHLKEYPCSDFYSSFW